MNTFAERLKIAINKKGISQAEAARKCGISQQSINYIISNNLISSKLAPKISSSLNINPDWLIYGEGRFEEIKVYELPIFDNPYHIIKFINNDLDLDAIKNTIIDTYLDDKSFAYLMQPKQMLICCSNEEGFSASKYLSIVNFSVEITEEKQGLSFPIFERRTRVVDF